MQSAVPSPTREAAVREVSPTAPQEEHPPEPQVRPVAGACREAGAFREQEVPREREAPRAQEPRREREVLREAGAFRAAEVFREREIPRQQEALRREVPRPEQDVRWEPILMTDGTAAVLMPMRICPPESGSVRRRSRSAAEERRISRRRKRESGEAEKSSLPLREFFWLSCWRHCS